MPTTLPLASRHMDAGLGQGAAANTSNLDLLVIAVFAATGLLLSLAFASLFPISTGVASLMASVS